MLILPGDRAREAARAEPDRNHEHAVERDLARAVERVSDLRLEAAALADRIFGEAGDEEFGGFNGTLDRARPVLAGQQLAGVQPGSEAGGLQSIAKLLGQRPILGD